MGFNSKRLDEVDIKPLEDPAAIIHCRADVARARMEPGVQHYAVDLVRRTRAHPFIHYGASPRASVALLLCSKALAAIRGREFVTPDDVRDVALPVLRHRLTLARRGRARWCHARFRDYRYLEIRGSPEIEISHRFTRTAYTNSLFNPCTKSVVIRG